LISAANLSLDYATQNLLGMFYNKTQTYIYATLRVKTLCTREHNATRHE